MVCLQVEPGRDITLNIAWRVINSIARPIPISSSLGAALADQLVGSTVERVKGTLNYLYFYHRQRKSISGPILVRSKHNIGFCVGILASLLQSELHHAC